jgi:hypothetical protein
MGRLGGGGVVEMRLYLWEGVWVMVVVHSSALLIPGIDRLYMKYLQHLLRI